MRRKSLSTIVSLELFSSDDAAVVVGCVVPLCRISCLRDENGGRAGVDGLRTQRWMSIGYCDAEADLLLKKAPGGADDFSASRPMVRE